MSVVPVVEAEPVEPAELVEPELELELELELQAAMISIAATPAAVADVTRREPAPMRLRSVMEPPGALSGLGARRCGLQDWHPECRVCRKIDPMSVCVNALKPCETRVISNGDLRCRPTFASLLVKHPMSQPARQPSGSGRAASGTSAPSGPYGWRVNTNVPRSRWSGRPPGPYPTRSVSPR